MLVQLDPQGRTSRS